MRKLLATLILVFAATGAAMAQEPMTGAEFEARVTGTTLTFGASGIPYGIERYLPGRRVIWKFIGDECREGVWFEANGQICFVYDHDPREHCWTFFDTEDGLRARFEDDPEGAELVEVERSVAPLVCPGPHLGA